MPDPRWERDPLSTHYDGIAYAVLLRAIRAGRRGAAVRVWIASPTRELDHPDKGGLTRHERAFTRACYWHIGGGPRSSARFTPRTYSLKKPVVVAGPVPQRPGVMVRQLRLRVFLVSEARRVEGAKSYVDNFDIRHRQGEQAV